ncbi:MAG: NAD-dependent epimerase/dehydratase family protein, partial [Actinomycetota bacterium]
AAGFIGSRLVAALAQSGVDVTAVDAFTDGGDGERKRDAARALDASVGVAVERLDLADAAEVRLDDVDVVYHLAGRPGVRTSWGDGVDDHLRGNVIATLRLVEAIATSKTVRRVVYASSSSVYGNALAHPTSEDARPRPVSPYGLTKLSAERILGTLGRPDGPSVVALRYFTVYGPGQRPDMALHRLFEAALTRSPFPRFGDGSQVRDLTYVDDVVAATIAAGAADVSGVRAVNVAGGSAVSLTQLIDAVGSLVGAEVPVDPRAAARGDVRQTSGSTERARDLLDWRPHVDLDEGLARQLAWHREGRTR